MKTYATIIKRILFLPLFLLLNLFSYSQTQANPPILPVGGNWSYLDDGSNQGTAWRSVGFDYSSWTTGNAEFGYGEGDEATVVGFGGANNNKHITTYFRKSFEVTASDFNNTFLVMNAIRDDGMVVYLNGVEVWRDNMPISHNYLTNATIAIFGAQEKQWITKTIPNALVLGTNEIAVEIHQKKLYE